MELYKGTPQHMVVGSRPIGGFSFGSGYYNYISISNAGGNPSVKIWTGDAQRVFTFIEGSWQLVYSDSKDDKGGD